MKPIRFPGILSCALIIVCLVGSTFVAQTRPSQPAQIRPTEKPFLWRIEGPVPSYLYGTVHVPDARVLEIPDVVRRALITSDVFTAEIPLDEGTQASLLGKIMLPPGQDLHKILGEDVFARMIRVIEKTLGTAGVPGVAGLLGNTLAPMKPWAAMSQIELLEFMPDIAAGRKPLDQTLYTIASNAKKDLGALETVEDQVNVFEGFTNEEQVRMLVATLDDLEKPRTNGLSPAQELVNLYLAGDLTQLEAEADKQQPQDQALSKKMTARIVDERNTKMATKIAELCSKKPARSYFFAVGALHYAGQTGIITQLTKKGFKITRLGPNDAASIVRKPAA